MSPAKLWPPSCPDETCKGPLCPLQSAAGRFYMPKDGREPRLWCCCCGYACHATDEEVALAERCERIFERGERARERQETLDAARQEIERKLGLLKQGRWK